MLTHIFSVIMSAVKVLKDHCISPQPPSASGRNSVKIQMDSGWSAGSRLDNRRVGAAEWPGHFLTDIVTSEKKLVSPFLVAKGKSIRPKRSAGSYGHSLAVPGHICISSLYRCFVA